MFPIIILPSIFVIAFYSFESVLNKYFVNSSSGLKQTTLMPRGKITFYFELYMFRFLKFKKKSFRSFFFTTILLYSWQAESVAAFALAF